MSKGKYASRAVNRVDSALAAENAALRAELSSLREASSAIEDRLRLEVGRLRADILAEASRLAAPELERRLAEVAEENRKVGLTVEGMRSFMATMDRFAMNACRYVSMVTGNPPGVAIDSVLTWITGEDYRQVVDVDDWLFARGLPSKGFMGEAMRGLAVKGNDKFARKRYRKNLGTLAVSLDNVEKNRDEYPVHPDYRPEWYGRVRDEE